MNKKKNRHSVRTVFFIKYFFWYLYFNVLTSLSLYFFKILKKPQNDNILWFIAYHDVFFQVIVFALAITGMVFFNHVYSDKKLMEVLQKELFCVRSKIVLFFVDVILIMFSASVVVVQKLSDLSNISSAEKLEIIPILLVGAICVKVMIKALGIEIMNFINIIFLVLSIPITLYNSLSRKIFNLDIIDWKKRVLHYLLIVFCGTMVLYIVAGLCISVKVTIAAYGF